jgi:hypothetical protein
MSGCFPILRERETGTLIVIGTGFYVTRYGLFLTAAHVLDDAFGEDGRERGVLFGLHYADDRTLHLRRVIRYNKHSVMDVALGELDNFIDRFPDNPLLNVQCRLARRRPQRGEQLTTYAYPENKALVMDRENPAALFGDYFTGTYRRFVPESDAHHVLRYPHFQMAVRIRSGASGAPIFTEDGGVFGLAVHGGEHEGDELAFGIPVSACMELGLDRLRMREGSWERRQVPEHLAEARLNLRQLITMGHVLQGN